MVTSGPQPNHVIPTPVLVELVLLQRNWLLQGVQRAFYRTIKDVFAPLSTAFGLKKHFTLPLFALPQDN